MKKQDLRPKDGASIRGAKGDKGEKGDSIKGDKGDSIKGDKGDKGDSITGDKGDAGDSIKGDKGDKGLIGKTGKGLRGLTGKGGKQGKSITGKDGKEGKKGDKGVSAYEIAVKNGFKGSARKWLRSLKAEGTKGGGIIPVLVPKQAAANGHLFSQYEKKTVANTIAETTLMGGGYGSITVPAGHFKERGYPLHLMLMGGWDKGANTTLTLKVKITQNGVTTIHHTKFFSNARLGGTVGGHWEIRAMFNCYTTGVSGNMMMHAMLQLLENDSAEILGLHSETPEFAFNTTLPFELFATAEWSLASELNTIHSSNVMIW